MIEDILKYSVSNLWSRKLRSSLTILSIMIGITAIVALSSFGLGIRFFVQDFAKQMGTDKIMMMPMDYMAAVGESNTALTDEDLGFIKKINGVDEAMGMTVSTAKVKFKDFKEKYPMVMGMSTDSSERRLAEEMFSGINMEKGRSLKKGDILKATVGYDYLVPNRIFKKPLSVGDKIEINEVEVEVVGFYGAIGNPQDDSQIYLSLEGAEKIFGKKDYTYFLLRSATDQNPAELADIIKDKFRKYRGQKKGEEDFFVQTFEQLMKTYGVVLNVLIGVLVLIALISVVVAAVNITNTMYTSILERTREIGVMKAIGAKNKDILFIFVVESGFLGLIGGVLGIIFGYALSNIGGYIASSFGLSMLKPYFPAWLMIGCLLFSFSVGAGSGLLPSIQASRQKPVESLRYE